MAVVQHAINQRCGHDFIAEHGTPFLEALVRSEHRRSVFIAPTHELEEQDRSVVAHGQVTDLIDYQQRGVGQNGQATR